MIPVTGFEDGRDNLWMMLLRTLAHLLTRVPSHIVDARRQERRDAGWLLGADPRERVDWYASGVSLRKGDQPRLPHSSKLDWLSHQPHEHGPPSLSNVEMFF